MSEHAEHTEASERSTPLGPKAAREAGAGAHQALTQQQQQQHTSLRNGSLDEKGVNMHMPRLPGTIPSTHLAAAAFSASALVRPTTQRPMSSDGMPGEPPPVEQHSQARAQGEQQHRQHLRCTDATCPEDWWKRYTIHAGMIQQ